LRHILVGSRAGLYDVTRAIAMVGIKPVIESVFEFEAAKEVYAQLESGSHVGKVIMRCSVPSNGATGAKNSSVHKSSLKVVLEMTGIDTRG
jgi:hypothetical protein